MSLTPEEVKKIAHLARLNWIVFLGQKTDVVGEPQQAFEQLPRLILPAKPCIGFGEPEAAGQKGCLMVSQPVRSPIASYQPGIDQVGGNRIDGADYAGIVEREETTARQQQARVQIDAVIALHETTTGWVKASGTDLGMDLGA